MSESTTGLITKENITLIIAVWGAALSTYKVISDHWKNIRNIKVKISYGFVSMGNRVGPDVLHIEAINTGYRDISLNSVGIILNNNSRLFIMAPKGNVQLPHTLKEGKSCTIWKEQSNLAQQLKKNGLSGNITIKGFYGSATGKVYESKPKKFDTERKFRSRATAR